MILYNIYLKIDYNSTLNITTNNGQKKDEVFHQNIIYKLQIENVGDSLSGEKIHIDFNAL